MGAHELHGTWAKGVKFVGIIIVEICSKFFPEIGFNVFFDSTEG